MAGDTQILPVLAEALTYPTEATSVLVARCARATEWAAPEVAGPLTEFAARLIDLPTEALQEQFIATFDFDPKCSLDIGWHLYGENYDRGDFLVRLRDLLLRHGIDEGHELPDHLPQVLRLLSRLPADEAASLAAESVVPAVAKILEGLGEREGAYSALMRGVHAAVSSLARPVVLEAPHV